MNKISLVGSSRQGLATEFKLPQVRKKKLGGITINYLIDFLQLLQLEKRAAGVYRLSPYRFKRGTLNMIKWCIDRDLISKRIEFKSSFRNRKDPKVFYKITDQGRELLRMIR